MGSRWIPRIAASGIGGGMNEQFFADELAFPVVADWAVAASAPQVVDTNNDSLSVRSFDDTAEEGVGFLTYVPAGSTVLTLTIVSRAETAPGAPATVVPRLYVRGISPDVPIGAWSPGLDLTSVDVPANENFQYDSETVTLAALGVSAAQVLQFELTRNPGAVGDTLVGDWDLLLVRVEFS